MILLGGLKDAAVKNWGMVVITLAVVALLLALAFVAERVLKKDEAGGSFKVRKLA